MKTATEEKVQSGGANEQTPAPEAVQTKGAEATAPERRETFFPPRLAENPFAFMRRFAGDMERFFEDFGSFRIKPLLRGELMPRVSEFGRAVWAPEVEFFERDGQFTVRADLPGLTKDDVRVEIDDGSLTLSGERRGEHEEKGEGYYRTERSYGSFFRRVPLPEGVKTEDATATFKNGVLEVVMAAPRREPKGRTLEIKEEATGGETKAETKAASA